MPDAPFSSAADVNTLRARLEKAGQSHLLAFYPGLTPDAQHRLLRQIAQLDLDGLDGLVERYVLKPAPFTLPAKLEPAPYFGADGRVRRGGTPAGTWDRAAAKSAGEALIRAGKVAAFVVAGGQGSRLGFEGPKGCYPATPVTNKTLFEVFGEQILATGKKYGVPVPWYVMTSPLNHEATAAFFREKRFFGLREQDVPGHQDRQAADGREGRGGDEPRRTRGLAQGAAGVGRAGGHEAPRRGADLVLPG